MSAVQIVLRNGNSTRRFTVDLDTDETVGKLKAKLQTKSGVSADAMKIVFCGRSLSDNTTLESLQLSPQTNFTVITKKQNDLLDIEPIAEVSTSQNANLNSFFVFCKKCDKMNCGKLRAYCTDCNSSSVFFYEEPQGWGDVLGYKKLKIDCKECEFGQTASIIFKCVDCSEEAVPLTEMRSNAEGLLTCEICGDSDFGECVTLDCGHSACVPCFVSYCEQSHAQRNFVRKANVGLTVSCPVYLCPGYVNDIHQFYLMGVDAYKRFQKQAAELFVAQQSESQCCPRTECGAAFFLSDEHTDEANILCPECFTLYCRYCRQNCRCKCNEKIVDASLETIGRTSKSCPFCLVPTERTGGCAHMRCTQCDHDWCFVCGDHWTDDCQWRHWFQ